MRRGAAEFGKSFWNLLDEYLEVAPWTRWGIHAILGAPAMKRATRWEQMFLPDYLARGVDSTRVGGEPLVETARTLIENRGRGGETPWYLRPFAVFAVCAAGLFLLLRRCRRRWLFFSVAIPFFVATGILGCLLVFLGFTEHPTTAPNANLLWANPLNLFAAAFIARRRPSRLIMIHLWLYFVMLVMALFVWALFVPSVLYSSMIIILWMGYLTIRIATGRLPGEQSGV